MPKKDQYNTLTVAITVYVFYNAYLIIFFRVVKLSWDNIVTNSLLLLI